MRKKLLSALLAATMVISLCACNNSKAEETTTAAAVSASNYLEQLDKDKETYKQYVTLGQYKGIEVDVDRSELEVSDEKVQTQLNNILQSQGTQTQITEGTTQVGDSVVMDYSGKLDGVAFSGGTATDVTYVVGSGQFISDLDKGLAGLEVGKEYDIPCKFPENYPSTDLAGKDVIFTVTVTAITKTEIPEFTDEVVKKLLESGQYPTDQNIVTTTDFTNYVRKSLVESAQNDFDDVKYSMIMDQLLSNTQVSGYPEEEMNSLIQTVKDNIQQEYATYGSMYGIADFNAYLSQVYQIGSEEAFTQAAQESAQSYLQEKMVLTMIGAAENITVTEEDIQVQGELIAKNAGYTDYQEVLNTVGGDIALEVGYYAFADKVTTFLMDNAVEK